MKFPSFSLTFPFFFGWVFCYALLCFIYQRWLPKLGATRGKIYAQGFFFFFFFFLGGVCYAPLSNWVGAGWFFWSVFFDLFFILEIQVRLLASNGGPKSKNSFHFMLFILSFHVSPTHSISFNHHLIISCYVNC